MQSDNPKSETNCKTSAKDNSQPLDRNALLLVAGTAAIIAGLLFPLPGRLLDVLLIFNISLAIAALIITFSAKSVLQVLGFPVLVLLLVCLQMVLNVASAKSIFLQNDTGIVINFFGNIFTKGDCAPGIFILGMGSVIVFGIICKVVKDISNITTEYTSDISLAEQSNLETILQDDGIDNNGATADRHKKTDYEKRFFVAMCGTGRLMLFGAALGLAIIIINITASTIQAISETTAAEASINTAAISAVGAGLITQIPALLAAAACKCLLRKKTSLTEADDSSQHARRIKVVANEVTRQDNQPPSESEFEPVTDSIIETEDSAFEEAQNIEDEICHEYRLYLWNRRELKDSSDYETISELIKNKSNGTANTILIAAEDIKELPAIVPVNIAIKLARQNRKCLLIDFNLKTDILSKIFDFDSSRIYGKAYVKAVSTGVDNIEMSPAVLFAKEPLNNLKDIIAEVRRRYDNLIIYAPNIRLLDDFEELADTANSAMLFDGHRSKGENSGAISKLYQFLTDSNCEIFEPEETVAEMI